MTTFVLRGYKGKCLHGTHYRGVASISGMLCSAGRQPVEALPEWIVKAFDKIPELESLVVSSKEHSTLYQRCSNEPIESETSPESGEVPVQEHREDGSVNTHSSDDDRKVS